MQGITISQPGKDYTLELSNYPDIVPDDHSVLVEIEAAGVNRADIMQCEGLYPPPDGISTIPGLEISGIITSIGSKVKTHAVGDKVCALIQGGGYATQAVVPEWRALPIPHGLNFIEAASITEALFTAYHNLLELGNLSPEKTILIHGGTSGIGIYAIQIAKIFGKHIFTTVGSDTKKSYFDDEPNVTAINYTTDDFVEVIRSSNHKAVDIVLDMVGGEYIDRNFKVLNKYGTLLSLSFLAGNRHEANFWPIVGKNLSWKGATIRGKNEGEIYDIAQSLRSIIWPLIESGQITPVIDSVFPLKDAMKAHDAMRASKHIGKIVLNAKA